MKLWKASLACVAAMAVVGCASPEKKTTERTETYSASQSSSPIVSENAEMSGTADVAGTKVSETSAPMSVGQRQREMVLTRLHHINQHEIEAAQLAEAKATAPEVKSAARMILADHQKLDDEVLASAKSFGFNLLGYQASTFEKLGSDRLKELSGSEFDREFIHMMRKGHAEVYGQLKHLRGEIKDSQLRAVVDTALPRIEAHRQMTASLEKKLFHGANIQRAGEADAMHSDDSSQTPGESIISGS